MTHVILTACLVTTLCLAAAPDRVYAVFFHRDAQPFGEQGFYIPGSTNNAKVAPPR